MSDRVAAIDIGTNAVLMLIARLDADGDVEAIEDHETITRLGEGVSASRTLSPAAAARTLRCLEAYAARIAATGASRVAAVGTSALRDATDAAGFLDGAERVLGARPRVIAGTEEAALTFEGSATGHAPAGSDVVVFDIGGGSTEIARGRCGHGISTATSVDVGSVRLTERFVGTDPPGADAERAIREACARAIAGIDLAGADALVGVAGTVTTVAELAVRWGISDDARFLSTPAANATAARIGALTTGERRAEGVSPARADVLPAGAWLLATILEGSPGAFVSNRGVRWGLARRLLSG